ncbi:S-layer homology domain-containing protein [Microcoleus sp. FACHB-831]|uniref:S-layer homology domain-containing protein n=1 Tax=Microcoleus sp. FACHB-831 TaxID=2692827 RepID=UPI001687A4CD|nr:S-layer homology domain-containing protein [Microcoleus sp. FACHB-831]MBD1920245.1 S-layer homology domain-containing protein [Microcoleus sp. FACHB-831]
MRRLLGTLSLLALLQAFPAVVYAQNQPATQQPNDPISQVVAAKLMTPYPDGKFRPEQVISRADLASILVKTFQLDKRVAAQQRILVQVPDVPTTHWAYNDIQTVLKTGIMKGYRGNLFFPNQKINRAEAFSIIAQAYGVFQFPDQTVQQILARYPDSAQLPGWAKKSMATALYEGFVNTDQNGNLAPNNPMTRGDMAYALSQYLARQQTPATNLDQDYTPPVSVQAQ